jgi:AcrR family transcriptional regulator
MARPIDPNLRIELLAAAEAEFAARGVDATRIDDIVARAGRSKGAFYQYFSDKEDAFRQIVEGLLARLSTLVATPLITDDNEEISRGEFLERWRHRDEAIFEFVWANRELVRMILRGGYSLAFADLMDAFAKRTQDVILDSITWAREHRIYRRDFDPHLVSVLIAGAYDRLARELADSVGERPNIRRWVGEAQRLMTNGILDF